MKRLFAAILVFCIFCLVSGCSQTPKTAEELIELSYKNHGGEALTSWKTLKMKGECRFNDGTEFRGEYLIFAQNPDKLRIERDLTKIQRGRMFFTEIYNAGEGWMSVNLIPYYNKAYAIINKRKLDHLKGIAYYRDNYKSFEMMPEEEIATVIDQDTTMVSAYVVMAYSPADTAKLYFEKKKFYLLQEDYKRFSAHMTRAYSDFRKYGDVTYGTWIREITKGRRGSNEEKFLIQDVAFNEPIDQKLFEEDKPSATN